MQPGALNIGRTDRNYAWDGTSWASDIRLGILANTSETWEFGIHDSGDSVMSAFYFNGGDQLLLGRSIGWGTLYIEAARDFRAPIFYDSNNTNFYADPASTSVFNALNVSTIQGRSTSLLMYYQGFTLNADTMDANSTGFTYAVNAPFVGPIIRISEGGYSMWLNSPYSGGGTGFAFRTRNGDIATINPWRYPAVYGVNANGGGDLFATIYYDQNNTGFYVDPNGSSFMSAVFANDFFRPQGATGIYWQSYDTRIYSGDSSYIRSRSNNGWTIYDRSANLRGYLYFDGSGFGLLNSSGNWGLRLEPGNANMELYRITFGNDFRAFIYYDRDNTGYYADPASTSIFNVLRFGTSTNGGRFDGEGTWGVRFRTNDGYIWLGPANTGHAHIYTDRPNFYFNVPLTVNDGSYINTGDIRSAIFYDRNDTTYYTDLNGGSYVRGRFEVAGGHGDSEIFLTTRGGELGSGQTSTMTWWVSEPNVTWNDGGFGYNVTNDGGSPGGFGRLNGNFGQAYMRFTTSGHLLFYNTNTSGTRFSTMDMYSSNYIYVHNYLEAGASLRAPIFFDSNNTSYYVDPTGFSEFGTTGLVASFTKLGTGPNSRAVQFANNQGDNSWGIVAEFRVNGGPGGDRPSILFSNGFDSQTWSCGYGFADSGIFRIKYDHGHRNGGWGTEAFYIDRGSNSYSPGSSRAPIFFDLNDTGRFIDPNGTSQTNSMRASEFRGNANVGGTGEATWHPAGAYIGGTMWQYGDMYKNNTPIYNLNFAEWNNGFRISQGPANYGIFNSWVRLDGHYGFYSGTNGAHFFPNNSTFGSWKMLGERNGWRGIHFGEDTGMTLMMNEGEFGFHRQSFGWTARFTSGTGFFNVSGTSGDITTRNISRAPNQDGINLNDQTFGSYLTSGIANANGPFGNGFWYNIVNVRHRGGAQDGNVWGLQIAAGMTNQARRIAFRTHVAGAWEPWAEFSHSLSDANFKVEDGYIENGIDLVMKLKPRYYYWKNYRIDNPERRAGFFAQEVHEVSPESAIEPTSDASGWGVEDRGLIAILAKAIQEQQVLIQQMQEEINNLKNR
jgi:hypothetical protein